MGERYVVSVWHGEGRSVFYVMDSETQDCMGSHPTLEDAQASCTWHNTPEPSWVQTLTRTLENPEG